MEGELEKALQDKQGESTSQPPQTSTTLGLAPLTQTTATPPAIPAPTTATSTIDATAAPESSMGMEDLMKSVKELEIQVT